MWKNETCYRAECLLIRSSVFLCRRVEKSATCHNLKEQYELTFKIRVTKVQHHHPVLLYLRRCHLLLG